MNTLEREAKARMREWFKNRMAAISHWRYEDQGEDACPLCFGTWISVKYTNGWESLRCCECGTEGPLPDQCIAEVRVKIIALALILLPRRTGIVRAEKRVAPKARHRISIRERSHLNIA